MKKTAMMQMIEYIERSKKTPVPINIDWGTLEKLLATEKADIEDSYDDGRASSYESTMPINGEEYYDETFKQEESK